MLQFTCGSTQPINYSKFDGIVSGYHLSLWGEPSVFETPNKIYRGQFLYGHKHKSPDTRSGCETIPEWVTKRVSKFPQVSEWVLVNEWSDDLGVPYPGYSLDDLKRYCKAAHLANPEAKLIIGEFKPHLLYKWEAIANICHELAKDFPVEVGIQTHLKSYNAPVVLARLPELIGMFDNIPVHFIEASLWYKSVADKVICNGLWSELISIAEQHKIQSFCKWWLCAEDIEIGRRMPTFENLKLFTQYTE